MRTPHATRTARPFTAALAAAGLVATGWFATGAVLDHVQVGWPGVATAGADPSVAAPAAAPAAPAEHADPVADRPGWSLGSTEDRRLAGQGFDVEHAQVGDDGTELGYFSCHVEIAPTIAVVHDTDVPGGGKGDLFEIRLNDGEVSTSDVVKQDPMGLAKVGWEEDLMPLPGYGYQAITVGVAHFDTGDVTAERGSSYRLVFTVPPGAHELRGIDLTFDWLDQGRTLHFAA